MDRVQIGSDEAKSVSLGSMKFSDIEQRVGSLARLIPVDFGER
jgi:hypothetical protein